MYISKYKLPTLNLIQYTLYIYVYWINRVTLVSADNRANMPDGRSV